MTAFPNPFKARATQPSSHRRAAAHTAWLAVTALAMAASQACASPRHADPAAPEAATSAAANPHASSDGDADPHAAKPTSATLEGPGQAENQNNIQRVVITGNPLGRERLAQPSVVISGDGLVIGRRGTLGELLANQPGVATTWFGPNANRPIIRGLDGDRVKVLDNASAAVDASSLSFDHAVAIDPLVAERVEVLRGPASLLYGGSATGGVVNIIDNRVPRAPLTAFGGRAELRFGGASRERALSALLEGGAGGFNWHVDGFTRTTSDLRVPEYTPVADGEALPATTRVRNSAAQGSGGAVGVSWADADGFVGVSLDTYRNRYGVVVEPEVTIAMRRTRLTLAGERRLAGPISKVVGRLSSTDYQHQELEGAEVGTTFKSKGEDGRLELHHAALGAWQGLVGVQLENMRFSALGEEAFVPATRTRSAALFVLEEARLASATVSLGLRMERVSVSSAGDAPDAEEPKFGAAQSRRFTPLSASASLMLPLGDAGSGWSASAVVGLTERAPAYYELYANGVHVATAAFEKGDAALAKERSTHIDLGLNWRQGQSQVRLHGYLMQFANFISLESTGQAVPVVGEDGGVTDVPEYAFKGVRARISGVELEGAHGVSWGGVDWTASASLDLATGRNTSTGEPLPRIAPMRLGVKLEGAHEGWSWGAGVRHAARQTRVPTTDSATAGYTLLNLWLAKKFMLSEQAQALTYVRLDNATNALAYEASSIATMRSLSPLPGRALSAGVQLRW